MSLFDTLKLREKDYLVFTLNRRVLIDARENLQKMIEAIAENHSGVTIVAPLRGLAKEAIETCQNKIGKKVLTVWSLCLILSSLILWLMQPV